MFFIFDLRNGVGKFTINFWITIGFAFHFGIHFFFHLENQQTNPFQINQAAVFLSILFVKFDHSLNWYVVVVVFNCDIYPHRLYLNGRVAWVVLHALRLILKRFVHEIHSIRIQDSWRIVVAGVCVRAFGWIVIHRYTNIYQMRKFRCSFGLAKYESNTTQCKTKFE